MSDTPDNPDDDRVAKFEPVPNLQIKREQKMYLDRTAEVLGKIIERNANSGPGSRQDMLDFLVEKQAFESLAAGLMRRPYDEACASDITERNAQLASTNFVHYATEQELDSMGWKRPTTDEDSFVFKTPPEN